LQLADKRTLVVLTHAGRVENHLIKKTIKVVAGQAASIVLLSKNVAPRSKSCKRQRTMKLKIFLAAAAVALSLHVATAQTANTNLMALIKDISTKIKDGQTSEAALTPELKRFDQLIAGQKGAKSEDAAQILFMKATLYLEVLENNDKGAELLKQLKGEYPETKFGKNADKMLATLAQRAASSKLQAGLAAGKEFPDFSEKDLSGKPLSVGALKGKVVLVDFWATWCGPCRAELPNVIETYKKYHTQGFEIIGVSLDSDRTKLDDFLKKTDGMTWPQFFDGEGWGNKLAKKYGVEAIPFTVLVGPDGKVIGNKLRGEMLASSVANALKK
jgi:thiol-disulfide isomerase/thioredoxin